VTKDRIKVSGTNAENKGVSEVGQAVPDIGCGINV